MLLEDVTLTDLVFLVKKKNNNNKNKKLNLNKNYFMLLGPWTRSPTSFTNAFYQELLNNKWTQKKWNGPLQYEDPTGDLYFFFFVFFLFFFCFF